MPAGPDLVRADLAWSPRLGVRWRTPVRGLTAKANIGRYFRLPSFYDLYANLGYFIGRPDLRPEVSLNADAGVVLERTGHWRLERVFAELGYFESRSDDLIIYTPGFRFTSPINVPGTTARGVESALALASGGVQLLGNYTYLDLRDDATGKRVPGRPSHEAYARLDAERPLPRYPRLSLGGSWETRMTAGMFADASNDVAYPTRLYHALGVRGRLRGFTLGLEIKNILDEQVELLARPNSACPGGLCPQSIEDFGGYPLPGRAFFATLSWKEP
jgi:outer membrane receptor protein involved in Fe transport